MHRLASRKLVWLLLALGLGNLLARLTFGLADVIPATRIVLDVVRAEFLPVAALLLLYGSALSPARGGWRLVGQLAGGALLAAAALTSAGLLAAVYQLARGHGHLQPSLYASGLYFNLGWPLLHLLALATFLRAVTGAWPGTLAAVGVYLSTRLAFEHPLLRFGAPISPWSDMNGYGPFLAEHLAAGAFWTAFSVLLLVAAHVLRRPHGARRKRLTANVLSTAWAASVGCVVFGLWLLNNTNTDTVVDEAWSAPQPTYSRLELAVDIFPEERRLTSHGIAIVVNRHDVAIPRIRFTLPPPMALHALSLTGQLEQRTARSLVYRLNRPLEPMETLRVEFNLSWRPEALPRARRGTGVLGNGTFVRAADIVPAVGEGDVAAAIVLRARVGTSLDQIAVAPGVLARRWKEEGRSYFEYHAQREVTRLAPILSGRYAVSQHEGQRAPIETYRHARAPNLAPPAAARAHVPNVDATEMPLRAVEVPDYQWFIDRSWLLGGAALEIDDLDVEIDGGVLCQSELLWLRQGYDAPALTTPSRNSASRRASS